MKVRCLNTHLNQIILFSLLFLVACGGGGNSSSNTTPSINTGGGNNPGNSTPGGNAGGGNQPNPNPQNTVTAKKIVFIYKQLTAQTCSGSKLKQVLLDQFLEQGYAPRSYNAQQGGASLNCSGRGKYCEEIDVGEQGAGQNDRCLVKIDLPYQESRKNDKFSKRQIVLLYKKISAASCVHPELKSELENLFVDQGYHPANIITQAENGVTSCNAYLDNNCVRGQAQGTSATDQEQCLIGFNLPVNGDEGSSSDPFMSRNTVFIYSHVFGSTCESQWLKDNLKNSFAQNGFQASNFITAPVDYSLSCNAYFGKSCQVINGGESGATNVDRCLVGVNLNQTSNAGTGSGSSGGTSAEVDEAILDMFATQYLHFNYSWIFGL